jgi:hypothetical protein
MLKKNWIKFIMISKIELKSFRTFDIKIIYLFNVGIRGIVLKNYSLRRTFFSIYS